MHGHKFDPAKAARLNDPRRAEREPPAVLWEAAALEREPGVIVDVGAGAGFFSTAFARMAPGAIVWACDVSAEMLAWLEEHLPADLRDRVRPLKVDEAALPLPDGCADLVLMANLHHELEEPVASLREAFRVLRPGGRIVIEDWKDEEMPNGPPLSVRCSASTILEHLAAAGFVAAAVHDRLALHHLVTADRP